MADSSDTAIERSERSTQRPRFRLGLIAFGLVLLSLCVHAYAAFQLSGADSAAAAGRVLGRFLGIFLFPLIFAYIAFRIARRSNVVGNITFCVSFLLMLLAGSSAQWAKQRNRQVLQRGAAETEQRMADMRQQLERDGYVEFDRAAAERTIDSIEKQANDSVGTQALFGRCVAALTREMAEKAEAYQEVVGQFDHSGGLSVAGMSSREQLSERVTLARQMAQSGRDFETFVKDIPDNLRRRLTQAGLDTSKVEQSVAGYSDGAMMDVVLKVRAEAARVAEASVAMLELLDVEWGAWHHSDTEDAVHFESADAAETYEQLLAQITEAGERMIDLQRQALSP